MNDDVHNHVHIEDEVLLEQQATDRTIPGDIVVKLASDAARITFYDVTIVNCLTERTLTVANEQSGPQLALEKALNETGER